MNYYDVIVIGAARPRRALHRSPGPRCSSGGCRVSPERLVQTWNPFRRRRESAAEGAETDGFSPSWRSHSTNLTFDFGERSRALGLKANAILDC
jgi:hypothetical protein